MRTISNKKMSEPSISEKPSRADTPTITQSDDRRINFDGNMEIASIPPTSKRLIPRKTPREKQTKELVHSTIPKKQS